MSLTSGQLDEIATGRAPAGRAQPRVHDRSRHQHLPGRRAAMRRDRSGAARSRAHRAHPRSGRRPRDRDPGDAHASGSFAGRGCACAGDGAKCSGGRAGAWAPGCDVRSDARARRRRHRARRRSRAARDPHARPCVESPVLSCSKAAGLLFTGDHLMQGSTVVIGPPDGNMRQYLQSLARLQREPVTRIAPGHGLGDRRCAGGRSRASSRIACSAKRRSWNACVRAGRANVDVLVDERLRRCRSASASGRERSRCSRICSSSKPTAAQRATTRCRCDVVDERVRRSALPLIELDRTAPWSSMVTSCWTTIDFACAVASAGRWSGRMAPARHCC